MEKKCSKIYKVIISKKRIYANYSIISKVGIATNINHQILNLMTSLKLSLTFILMTTYGEDFISVRKDKSMNS